MQSKYFVGLLSLVIVYSCCVEIGCGSGSAANTAASQASSSNAPTTQAGSSATGGQQPQTPLPNSSTDGGQQTPTPPSPPVGSGQAPATTLQTKYVYTVGNNSQSALTIQGYAIDDFTGVPTVLSAAMPEPLTTGLEVETAKTDPQGRFLYVLATAQTMSCAGNPACTGGEGTNAIVGFQVNPQTGVLTQMANPVILPQQVSFMDMVPSGQYLYVDSSQGLWIFSIDQSSGSLTQVSDTPLASNCLLNNGGAPRTMAMDSNGQYLYCAEGGVDPGPYSVASYAVDSATGVPSSLVSRVAVNAGIGGGALSSDGRFYFLSDASGIAVLAVENGSLAAVAGSPFFFPQDLNNQGGFSAALLLADPQGFLLALRIGNAETIRPDPNSGALSSAFPNPVTGCPTTLDTTGRFLYSASFGYVFTYSVSSNGIISQVATTSILDYWGDPTFVVAVNLPVPTP